MLFLRANTKYPHLKNDNDIIINGMSFLSLHLSGYGSMYNDT